MKDGPDIAALAAVIGNPARANMLTALMSGMALTAGELAREASVTPQTTTSHLGMMTGAGLLLVEVQGRHRYFRIAGPEVAAAIEGLMGLAARMGKMRSRPGPRDEEMRRARVCYDHLAGEAGVRLHDAMIAGGHVIATPTGLGLSDAGRARLVAEGIEIAALEKGSRPLCRACLDWSERRHHLGGSLGAALLDAMLDRAWAKRDPASRVIRFSGKGLLALEEFIQRASPLPGTSSEASGHPGPKIRSGQQGEVPEICPDPDRRAI